MTQVRILGGQGFHHREGAVRAAVVHEKDLVFQAERGDGGGHSFMQRA